MKKASESVKVKAAARTPRAKPKDSAKQKSLAVRVSMEFRERVMSSLGPGESVSDRLMALLERDLEARSMTNGQWEPGRTQESMLEELLKKVDSYGQSSRKIEMGIENLTHETRLNHELFRKKLGIK